MLETKDAKKDEKIKQIMDRKEEHIDICLNNQVAAKSTTTLFECVKIFNNPLPEIDYEEIDTSVKFLGHELSAPLIVGAMTGGAYRAMDINSNIAIAVEEMHLGMAVGSQRAALYDPKLEKTYSIARKKAPTAFIGSNIGGAQISTGFNLVDIKKLISMLDADAQYVHLNPSQEIVQPEGTPTYRNVIKNIDKISKAIDIPIIAKEVGCGIDGESAKKLESSGVKAIEIAGLGGTSYNAIEYYRARTYHSEIKERIGLMLWDWGIPTAASVINVRKNSQLPIIASGGIRNGLDIAKALILGSSITAMALPILRPATQSSDAVKLYLRNIIEELKAVMFITGSKNIEELRNKKYIITGELKDWIGKE